MTKAQIDALKLEAVMALNLDTGAHASFEKGLCVMEAVSYVAGEAWSDNPQCACPVIAAFLRAWNDRMPDDERQQLKQYIPLLVGSRSTEAVEHKRRWMMTDWVVRDCTPRWLRRAGMEDKAAILESLAPLTGQDDYAKIKPALVAIREETYPKRQEWRDKFVDAFKKKLEEKKTIGKAAADAAAYAAADAAAYAAAYAAYAAAYAAYAAAYAAADAADAAAYAAYAAADAADAAADAADAADAAKWSTIRDAVYKALRKVFAEKLGATRAESQASAHELMKRLLAVKP